MKIAKTWKSLIGAMGLLALGTSSQAAVLFSDDFNHGQTATTNFSALANWTVTTGTVDAFTAGGFSLPCPSLGCLDMDGSTSQAGTIQTNTVFNLPTGSYEIFLNYAGNQRGGAQDTMQVFFGGTLLTTLIVGPTVPYTGLTVPLNVAAASNSGPLIISHAGGDNVGILLDRVELRSLDNGNGEVPAPATLALLGLGLAGLGYRRRKQIKES